MVDASPEPSFLDLHVHSTDGSDDAGGTVEGYLKWVVARRRQGYRIDGFALTEHRNWDPARDYRALEERYGVVILRGVEVETDIGHVLVFGVTPEFTGQFDLSAVSLPYQDVFRVAWETGGIAVGAHAGRPQIGVLDHVDDRDVSLEGVRILEVLNGGSSDFENERARELAEARGIRMVGASDAHFVSALGRCLTRFDQPVRSTEELVAALRDPDSVFAPMRIEDTRAGTEESSRPASSYTVAATSRQGSIDGDAVEYDRSVLGQETLLGRLEVTRDLIERYCRTMLDENPLYLDEEVAARGPYGGIIAPPGLVQLAQEREVPDVQLKFEGTRFLGRLRSEYREVVRPGDTIEALGQVREVYEKTGRSGRLVFISSRTRFVNQHGIDVAIGDRWMLFRRARDLDAPRPTAERAPGASA